MNEDFMLTTFDNPFNPFTDFVTWFKQDLLLGHNCCGILYEYSNVSDITSEEVQERETIEAMKEITKDYPMIYRIVKRSDYEEDTAS